uniref:NADH-ubiquinone oxidoreductase chain 5 n=1 Tax=Orcula dolium TaxID=1331962 RepID=A0A1W5IC36_9EUPU|nr:NADH dehydrogenase subunit 5 [Orcula dolium]AIR76264.1 NADH dehydrogenase subunit 5 [Orcula dolium]
MLLKFSKFYRLPLLLLVSSSVLSTCFFLLLLCNQKSMLAEVNIFSISSTWISVLFIFDKVSLSFSMVVSLISLCVFSFATSYMAEDLFKFRFGLILMLFVVSMNILIFSGSLFLLLLGWDGLGISSFALIIYYQSIVSLKAGYLTLMTNRMGDVVILMSIPFMLMTGSISIFPITYSHSLVVLLLLLASLTKSAQYPFSAWLPAAMAAPTPVSALVHSSTLVTAGVYLIIRVSMSLGLDPTASSILLFCGGVTCFLGGVSAIFENDIKKVIAFSTLSQLGLMVFCLGMIQPNLALLHLYTHAMFKALLFLCAGLVLMINYGNQDMRLMGSLLLRSPVILVFFNISSFCLMGAPFISSYYSKHVIYELMVMSKVNMVSVTLMLVGATLTSIYSTRMLKVLSWGKLSTLSLLTVLSFQKYVPLALLFLLSICSGKMFWLLDTCNLSIMYTSSYYQLLMYGMLLTGVVVGLSVKPAKSFLFSSIMFLWESSNKMISFFHPITKYTKTLDYGWLEPMNSLSNTVFKIGDSLSKMFKTIDFYLITMARNSTFCVIFVSLCFYFWQNP